MEDIRFYEFLLKLTTYLKHTNTLAEKFAFQEEELGKRILNVKHTISKDEFNTIFFPVASLFEERLKLMGEIREANNDFENMLREYYEYFRGTVQ